MYYFLLCHNERWMSKLVETGIFVQVWLMIEFQNSEMGVQQSYFWKQTLNEKRNRRAKSEMEKSSKVAFKYVTRTKGLRTTMCFSTLKCGEKLSIRISTTFGWWKLLMTSYLSFNFWKMLRFSSATNRSHCHEIQIYCTKSVPIFLKKEMFFHYF